MDKQKQIEEMKKHIKNSLSGVLEIEIDKLAEELMKYYQPKIPDGAVVLTVEEKKKILHEMYKQGEFDSVMKLAERLKKDHSGMEYDCEGEHLVIVLDEEELDEIVKELTEGKE